MLTKDLFTLRGKLPAKTKMTIEILGGILFLIIWELLTFFEIFPKGILPSPFKVLSSIPELHFKDYLVRNVAFSMKLNLYGYLEAVAVSVPLGFVIGLLPLPRALFERYISALRYLPLTAVTGLFIAWFGIYTNMKVQFLALGIIVYLLPVVIQRVDEVKQVYQDTIRTLGASKWQTIREVFIPDVMSRLFDDIRVLIAISWTYIIVAEATNQGQGGVGALINIAQRQSRIDKIFAILVIIILIGFAQDKLLVWLDKKFFAFKHA